MPFGLELTSYVVPRLWLRVRKSTLARFCFSSERKVASFCVAIVRESGTDETTVTREWSSIGLEEFNKKPIMSWKYNPISRPSEVMI